MTRESKNSAAEATRSTYLSPAKINLILRITSKRSDGYHNILSLMQPISLYDEVEVEVNTDGGIDVKADVPGVPNGPENLAYRAARLFLDESGIKSGVKVSIRKRIPHGAGLGGGSSNAATVLVALNELSGAGFSVEKLMALGAELGSDVPFFMLKTSAIATGRGTELRAVKLPSYQYVLINPGFGVSTEWAYSNFILTNGIEDNTLFYSEDTFNDLPWLTRSMYNDLESVTASVHPQIAVIKEALVRAGAEGALMSGSGPTLFGIFSDHARAATAAASLRESLGDECRVFHVEGL
ncbi:MAG: 4-(cytidine 5'-diphospho)-2-C-methyl-D-erythritol kinase [Proteobacteria bacterium]|nr:4-(cytidine 5'-diphospho)-2-C-methyl-D-erythritol kinase [Pseudomonadota bacterium]